MNVSLLYEESPKIIWDTERIVKLSFHCKLNIITTIERLTA